jgi:hypothetical protein
MRQIGIVLWITISSGLAVAAASVNKAQIPIYSFFNIQVRTEPKPSNGKGTFKVPSLEIFAPDGAAIYYSDSTQEILKTFATLHSDINKLKPIKGYIPWPRLKTDLQTSGAKNLGDQGRTAKYTLFLVQMSGGQCEPCNQVKGAIEKYLRENPNTKDDIVELELINGNR